MKDVTLIFKREELLADCATLGYVEGDVMKTEDPHARHQVQDIVMPGNEDWVSRVLGLGIAVCRELLYPYSKSDVEQNTTMDDELEKPEAYAITLSVPDTFSRTTVTLLEHLIHMLLVYMVMEQWMSLTNVDNKWSKANWTDKIDKAKEEITGTLNARTGRVRKSQSPF